MAHNQTEHSVSLTLALGLDLKFVIEMLQNNLAEENKQHLHLLPNDE